MSTDHAALEIGHPAPHRAHVAPLPMLFALLGAPAAWMLELLINFAVTSYVCYPGISGTTVAAAPGWLQAVVIAANIVALAIAIAALLVGMGLARRTRDEHRQRSGGVMDAGEGRTRFLAVWGLFTAMVFIVAVLANTFSLFLVPICHA